MKSAITSKKLPASNSFSKFITHPLVVALLAILCNALWGSAFPCIKLGYQWFHVDGVASQIYFAGLRFALAGVATLLFGSIMEKRLLTLPIKTIPSVLVLGLMQTAVQYLFFYIGLAHTTGSKGSIIYSTNVFFAILIANFVVPEDTLTPRKVFGCILGFAGVILICFSHAGLAGEFLINGEGFLLICSFIYGMTSVMVKFISNRGNPIAVSAYQLIFGGLILIIAGKSSGGTLHPCGAEAYLIFGYLVLLSAVSFALLTILYRYNPVTQISIFGFFNPVFGIIFSGIVLHEHFISAKNIFALIIVSIGIFIVNKNTNE